MTFIATFYTNYGAVKFFSYCINYLIQSRQMPVPRALSSSCGTCVRFDSVTWETVKNAEDLEACYIFNENAKEEPYVLVYRGDN